MENRNKVKIDKAIDPKEVFIRCLLRPLMLKGKNVKKLNHTAILPPPEDDVVSVLRLRYITEDDAVEHGKSLVISGNTFCGIARIANEVIISTNEWALSDDSISDGTDGVNGIQATMIASPMYSGDDYVPKEIDVYLNDGSITFPLHAHAEIKYNNVNSGDIRTRLRAYANQLLKKIQYKLIDKTGKFVDEIGQ